MQTNIRQYTFKAVLHRARSQGVMYREVRCRTFCRLFLSRNSIETQTEAGMHEQADLVHYTTRTFFVVVILRTNREEYTIYSGFDVGYQCAP